MFGEIRGHSADDDTASSATTGHELLEWSATAGHELLERSATAGHELLERSAGLLLDEPVDEDEAAAGPPTCEGT
jgi:hypothetical protein